MSEEYRNDRVELVRIIRTAANFGLKPALLQVDAVLGSTWLAERDARMRAEGIRRAREAVQREESNSATGGLVHYTKVIDAIDALEEATDGSA